MRKHRVVVPGCPHHIVHRGNNRRRLFSYSRDYHLVVRYLHAAVEETRCRVHALCLMANHMHLVVTPPSVEALSWFAKFFAQRYSQHRNSERDGSGKLFEGRFWSEPIRSTFHLAVATMYIDRNPVSAGIKADGEQYRWSTYRQHSGIGRPERFIEELCEPSDWYRALGVSATERAKEYQRMYLQYSATALAEEQRVFFSTLERGNYTRRLERPNRVSARDAAQVSRYGLKSQ